MRRLRNVKIVATLGPASNDLVSFMTLANNHDDLGAHLNNIQYNPVAVPETSVALLGGLGMLGLLRRRRNSTTE